MRSITHRASLGVVVGAGRIEIDEVLGSVLSDTEVSDGDSSFGVELLADCVGRISVLVLVFILLITGAKVRVVLLVRLAGLCDFSNGSEIGGGSIVNLVLSEFLPGSLDGGILLVDAGVF
jgi:hypothetical protein